MKTMMRRLVAGTAVTGILATFALSATVRAGSATSTVAVSASVPASCTISAGTLAFSTYDPLSASNLDAAGSLSIACAKGTAYEVLLGNGGNYSSGRRMSDGSGSFLGYEVYSNAGRTTVFGGTTGNGVGATASSKNAVSISLYGRITAGQDVATGSYSDSVQSTINF
jgi:spore coat protein U-like protein